jgi:hypothetical protein
MKYLLLLLLLTACTTELRVPISQFDLEDGMCHEGASEFTWKGETKSYNLHITDDPQQMLEWCGLADNHLPALACIKGTEIYTPVPCEKQLAHELNHLFGSHWVDNKSPMAQGH